MSLDPIAKEVWCEALRSGEFKQGTNWLRSESDDTYCCLGVAREVFPWLDQHEDAELLSAEACKLLGIDISQQEELSRMNDDGDSFAAIADYIETL